MFPKSDSSTRVGMTFGAVLLIFIIMGIVLVGTVDRLYFARLSVESFEHTVKVASAVSSVLTPISIFFVLYTVLQRQEDRNVLMLDEYSKVWDQYLAAKESACLNINDEVIYCKYNATLIKIRVLISKIHDGYATRESWNIHFHREMENLVNKIHTYSEQSNNQDLKENAEMVRESLNILKTTLKHLRA